MMMVYPPGSEIDATSPPGFHVLALSIPKIELEDWNDLNGESLAHRHRWWGKAIRINSSKLAAIRHAAQSLISAAETGVPRIHLFSDNVVDTILKALPTGSVNRQKWYEINRSRISKALIDYIEANLPEQITLKDLCSFAKVSPRTIQRTFKHRFGVTYIEYIRARRLNHVHRELVQAKGRKVMVSDIANYWGFWHMGQFASDYRKFYGELPSETLANTKK